MDEEDDFEDDDFEEEDWGEEDEEFQRCTKCQMKTTTGKKQNPKMMIGETTTKSINSFPI